MDTIYEDSSEQPWGGLLDASLFDASQTAYDPNPFSTNDFGPEVSFPLDTEEAGLTGPLLLHKCIGGTTEDQTGEYTQIEEIKAL